jgi:hypothetical protein
MITRYTTILGLTKVKLFMRLSSIRARSGSLRLAVKKKRRALNRSKRPIHRYRDRMLWLSSKELGLSRLNKPTKQKRKTTAKIYSTIWCLVISIGTSEKRDW